MVEPPRILTPKLFHNPAAALNYEIAQEKASNLGRLGRALEAALAALATFDAETIEPTPESRKERGALVAQAGYALWLFVVQREALGLRDSRQVTRDYRVPADVQNRMGMLPTRTPR
jgi:hypothetical protein